MEEIARRQGNGKCSGIFSGAAVSIPGVASGDTYRARQCEANSAAHAIACPAVGTGSRRCDMRRVKDYRAALAAVRELCRIVELMAKLSGELDSHSETKILNVTLDPETAQRISKTFLARHQSPVEIT